MKGLIRGNSIKQGKAVSHLHRVSASGMEPKPFADADGPKKLVMTGRQ